MKHTNYHNLNGLMIRTFSYHKEKQPTSAFKGFLLGMLIATILFSYYITWFKC